MLTLHNIVFSDRGRKISYDYTATDNTARFFTKESLFVSYNSDVSAVPESINVIPLLANVMPIAWFAGFDVFVDEVDEDFYQALENIRNEWIKIYPEIAAKTSVLHAKKIIKNAIAPKKNAMLFSGGVDAFATYFRHYDETPDLITIQGADIELTDTKQWEEVKAFNENEPVLAQNNKQYIQTNFQAFYNYNVDLLLPNMGWWGNIQHGLALIGVLAPLSYLYGYGKIYIASTRSIQMEFNPWGSMPETDEKISWAGIEVVHDGFELKRQDKVDAIVEAVKKLNRHTTIRVCYSELKKGLNCSRCEKCVRTMFGIMLAGDNPNHYGFQTDASIYDSVKRVVGNGFKSRGTQFFWSEILEKAKDSKEIFVFSDAKTEATKREEILRFVNDASKKELVKSSESKKMKYVLINKYPRLFQFYLKLRRSL